jgi:hypothetical protein
MLDRGGNRSGSMRDPRPCQAHQPRRNGRHWCVTAALGTRPIDSCDRGTITDPLITRSSPTAWPSRACRHDDVVLILPQPRLHPGDNAESAPGALRSRHRAKASSNPARPSILLPEDCARSEGGSRLIRKARAACTTYLNLKNARGNSLRAVKNGTLNSILMLATFCGLWRACPIRRSLPHRGSRSFSA